MSKRRASFNEDDCSAEGSSIRSAKINRTVSSVSTVDQDHHHQNEDLSFSQTIISHILTRIDVLSNIEPIDIPFRTELVLDFFDERQFPMLHYQNQLIEIPLTGEIQLSYNQNFPYRRDPVSISTDVDYFLENLASFKIFKKVMIKNCHMFAIPNTIKNVYKCNQCGLISEKLGVHDHEENIEPTSLIKFQCQITSSNNSLKILECPITEDTLRFSNILLEKSHLWNAISGLISAAQISPLQKSELEFECFHNLFSCLQKMDNINIAVNVNSDGQVIVNNIFHDYFTV